MLLLSDTDTSSIYHSNVNSTNSDALFHSTGTFFPNIYLVILLSMIMVMIRKMMAMR